jgi:uracil-DNA glycosylase
MAVEPGQQLRAYVEYLRDLGIHDFYRQGDPVYVEATAEITIPVAQTIAARPLPLEPIVTAEPKTAPASNLSTRPAFLEPPIAKLVSFDDLAPLPESRVAPAHKVDALVAIQEEIGDCTRCPLAYAGRRKIVFGDGDANARLMFVGEGP